MEQSIHVDRYSIARSMGSCLILRHDIGDYEWCVAVLFSPRAIAVCILYGVDLIRRNVAILVIELALT